MSKPEIIYYNNNNVNLITSFNYNNKKNLYYEKKYFKKY